MRDYILTVMARDRVGIVRDVSTALARLGGNITHLSQTVMRDYFTLIISAQMPDERSQLEIRQAVERTGDMGELEVNVRPYEEAARGTVATAERFMLSMLGKDQPGIISRTTTSLAERCINVDDFYAYVHDGTLLMLAEVSIPTGVDVDEVQEGLEQVGRDFGLVVHFQHENIFRATSDVRPVTYFRGADS